MERLTTRDMVWHQPGQPPGSMPVATRAADGGVDRPCVLVADDEAYIVEFLSILLEDEGFTVLRAYDGQQAWNLARERHPDLVISDVMMPKMNGLELLDRMRNSGNGLTGTPVIMMSAVTRDLRSERAAFLPKPFDIDHMLRLVATEMAAA